MKNGKNFECPEGAVRRKLPLIPGFPASCNLPNKLYVRYI